MSKPININQLEEYFNSIDLDAFNGIKIENYIIDNVQKMVSAHIQYLRSNKGNKAFQPYYERLVTLYNKIR